MPGATVRVDPLVGGDTEFATVLKLDRGHDLAVLLCRAALPAVAGPLISSRGVPAHTKVIITGVPIFPDRQKYRFTHAVGEWHGTAQREDGVDRGQLTAPAVVAGMSGSPVRTADGDRVVGVLSARYNSSNEWLRHTVWVAGTDDLAALLADVSSVKLDEWPKPRSEPEPKPAPQNRRTPVRPSREQLERMLRRSAGGLCLRLASQVKPAELASARNRLPLQSGEEILAMGREVVSRRYIKAAWDLLSGTEPPSDLVALTTHGLRTALAKPTADNRPAWVPYADLTDVRFEVVTEEVSQFVPTGVGGYHTTSEVKVGYVTGDGIRSYLAGVRARQIDNWRDFVAELTS